MLMSCVSSSSVVLTLLTAVLVVAECETREVVYQGTRSQTIVGNH